jgi:hypothetical protein
VAKGAVVSMLVIENPVLVSFPTASLTFIVPPVFDVKIFVVADCRVAPSSKL